jgi:broad specificity phosphatase PhoE
MLDLFVFSSLTSLALKQLYIIRHGETEYNRQNMVQGSGIDAALNDTGREQARRFFAQYASEGFKKVYTSALIRTHQSVERFTQMGLATEQFTGLNEISWGAKEGRPITEDDNVVYFDYLQRWRAGDTTLAFEGGESPQQVADRMWPVMEDILARENEDKILICIHGRAMRVLLCLLLRYPLSCMDAFPHQNLCLYKVVATPTVFQLHISNEVVGV